MNYKERFAGLNANEIIKRLEEEEKPFNPSSFGFKKMKEYSDVKKLRQRYLKIKKNGDQYLLIYFPSEDLFSLEMILTGYTDKSLNIMFQYLKISNKRFARELLKNLGVI